MQTGSQSKPAGDTARPPWRRLLAEGPALVRLAAAQLRHPPVRDDGAHKGPVMVIPALLANDLPTRLLRRTLAACGHPAYPWGQGINRGADAAKFRRLLRRIDEIVAREGERLSLVGWSLGGLYARELARRRPGAIATVITLGTPFSHGQRANNAWKLYELINDHDVDHPPIDADPAQDPPVRTIACWSPRDGIVAPASARGEDGEVDERIELHCRHNAFVSDPEALRTIVKLLE
jgi:pimeloyl-ACP methyl ester carboxylesterase